MTCTATYVISQADADHGSVYDVATVTGTPPAALGLPPATARSIAAVIIPAAPSLALRKTAAPATVSSAGTRITFRFALTNTGNVTIHGQKVDEVSFNGAGPLSPISCPAGTLSLAPGQRETCTATYITQPADLAAGKLVNKAVATGKSPSGQAVRPAASTATVQVRKPPPSIASGVPGNGSGPSPVETGFGIGLILAAASAVTGLVMFRRRVRLAGTGSGAGQ
jgi:hypothetical protein